MKKKLVLLLTLAFVSLGMLTACSSPSPTETLTSYLEAVKDGDKEAAQTYYAGTYEDLEDVVESEESAETDSTSDEIEKISEETLLPKLYEFEYELSNEQIDGDNATVDATITTYNVGETFQSYIADYITQALSMGFSGATEEEINALGATLLQEKLDGMEKTYTKTVSVPLVKKDGKWKVAEYTTTDDLTDALAGGLISYLSGLDGTLSDSTN